MGRKEPGAEDKLLRLQYLIQRPAPAVSQRTVRTGRIPLELTGGQKHYIGLTAEEDAAAEHAAQALQADLRFEHVRDPAEVVWDFICRCWLDRTTDQVPALVQRHGREVTRRICYIPVEFLSVVGETEVLGIRLLSVDDSRVPASAAWFKLDAPVGCVAAIDVMGTSADRMAERARTEAAHAMRRLRIALREDRAIHDRQLRFRLATTHAFETGESGWKQRSDVAYNLELSDELVEFVSEQSVGGIPLEPLTDIDRKGDLALRWMERAWLSGDPLTALLFLFFALEALLGDKSEGLKAHGLAFRQTMLSHILTESFFHPNETWFLYDRVRSGAVHGEDVPDVDWETVDGFARVVRQALNQYLTFARDRKITRRGRLLRLLDEHPARPELIAWLRQAGGSIWTDYLDRLAAQTQNSSLPQ